jgi:hypothetical protein
VSATAARVTAASSQGSMQARGRIKPFQSGRVAPVSATAKRQRPQQDFSTDASPYQSIPAANERGMLRTSIAAPQLRHRSHPRCPGTRRRGGRLECNPTAEQMCPKNLALLEQLVAATEEKGECKPLGY